MAQLSIATSASPLLCCCSSVAFSLTLLTDLQVIIIPDQSRADGLKIRMPALPVLRHGFGVSVVKGRSSRIMPCRLCCILVLRTTKLFRPPSRFSGMTGRCSGEPQSQHARDSSNPRGRMEKIEVISDYHAGILSSKKEV